MVTICRKCKEPCTLQEVYAGSFFDDAYGYPKWFEQYEDVSDCCGAEFEEWDEDEYADIFGEDALDDALSVQ